jgi:RNA-directed DNA polymerase
MPTSMSLLGLPSFNTTEELAALIHIDEGRLVTLTEIPERFYRRYRIPKRHRGWREIQSPSKELKAIQAWILRNILDKLSSSAYATAYTKGRGLLDNVNPHLNNRYFLSIDIRNFFPSVSAARVRELFVRIGYSKDAAKTLCRLCSFFRGLPQGAVTSPALSNLVCVRLDRRLSGLTSRRNIVFTRYADDMTFSTNNRDALPRLLPLAYQILRDMGFEPNERKTRMLGPRARCAITGLVKNSTHPAFGIGRKKKTAMRSIMHNFLARGIEHPDYPNESSIEGWINFAKTVDPASHEQMLRHWNAQKKKYPPIDDPFRDSA